MPLQFLCIKDLDPRMWHYLEVMKHLRGGAKQSRGKLGHLRHSLKWDIETLTSSSSVSLLPRHHEGHGLLYHELLLRIYCATTGPTGSKDYDLKPLNMFLK